MCFLSLQSAVGLFGSEVKAHLLLFANRGTKEFTELKEQLGALAPEFTGKVSTELHLLRQNNSFKVKYVISNELN